MENLTIPCSTALQYFLKAYLTGPAFTQEELDEAEPFLRQVFGRDDVFDKSKFQYILDEHNGHLPVRIRAGARRNGGADAERADDHREYRSRMLLAH